MAVRNVNQLDEHVRIECTAELDALGDPEEFTLDMSYIANSNRLWHLTDDGLPKVGTVIQPGMIVIGMVGRKSRPPAVPWNKLELLTATDQQLEEYYASWLYDASFYADDQCAGTVVSAYFSRDQDPKVAVVELARE